MTQAADRGETGDVIRAEVQVFYEALPSANRRGLSVIRETIFALAASDDTVGQIDETLKWGVPSYATLTPVSGTPIRLSVAKSRPDMFEISVHCQSTLIADFKEVYPHLEYDRNRSLLIEHSQAASDEVVHFIRMALTYHQRRKKGIGV